jgi:hypothetical protein
LERNGQDDTVAVGMNPAFRLEPYERGGEVSGILLVVVLNVMGWSTEGAMCLDMSVDVLDVPSVRGSGVDVLGR